MKLVFYFSIFLIFCFIVSCEDDPPCQGFSEEPVLQFNTNIFPMAIEVENHLGETVRLEKGENQSFIEVPLNMNTSTLKMDVFLPEYKGTMVYHYTIYNDECYIDHRQTIHVKDFFLDSTSTYKDVYITDGHTSKSFIEFSREGVRLLPENVVSNVRLDSDYFIGQLLLKR